MHSFLSRVRYSYKNQVSELIDRWGYHLFWRTVKLAFTIGYSSFFVYAVFFARRRRGLTERFLNPVPVVGTAENFLALANQGPKEIYEFSTNFFGNIVLFIPVSFILISLLRIKTLPKVLLASFILSLTVEVTQFILKRGVADVDDILLNTLGAWAGFCLYRKLFGETLTAEA